MRFWPRYCDRVEVTVVHEEQPVWIALNGMRRIVLSCSPHDIAELALGNLVADGWVQRPAEVLALVMADDSDEGGHGVSVQIEPGQLDAAELVRRHQTLHGCGVRHVLDCDPFAVTPVEPPSLPIDPGPLLRSLFATADEHAPDGGMHAAALSDGGALLATSVDVARHCALDRVIGVGLRDIGDLSGLGLVCTARISGAMALKAVRARLAWIASRSIATSLAHEIAAAHGMLLMERAGRTARQS